MVPAAKISRNGKGWNMIDFTDCETTKARYGGANGGKLGIIYQGERYLLKFPGKAKLADDLSYTNGSISEYIGSHIFNAVGIQAQETELGVYQTGTGAKLVVACKDFADQEHGIVLQDFASIKNSVIDSDRHGYGTNLNDVLESIQDQDSMDPDVLMEHFWDMFVVDEMLGNPDRHNGNWGILYDFQRDTCRIAPVYDCGSALFPQASAQTIQKMLSSKQELNIRVYERPTSALTLDNGKRINYNTFNEQHMQDYPDYCRALIRMEPKINMINIGKIIDNTPGLNNLQAEFYKTIITERKRMLLDRALDRAIDLGYTKETMLDDRPIPGAHDYSRQEQKNRISLQDFKEKAKDVCPIEVDDFDR